MKILIVSAHFPPNFISGGTLVPMGLAHAFRQRGHEVHVFAGWRGDDRGTGEQRDETDEAGVRIRWINTTPWLSDLDDRQFDNPDVAQAFAKYCEAVRPSVINFHSVQGLGAGTIDVAASAGVPVVVVMHDFWWWCGRMFMSDRGDRPCSPVVDCGVCECSVDSDWLVRRNTRLASSLDAADRVVCVSSTLARVARANGVSDAQLVTIENGLPSFPVSTDESRDIENIDANATGVRFVYAGGPDPWKGPYVLAEALTGISDLPGWSLTTYGWPEDAEVPPTAPIHVQPPFAPEAVTAVMKTADMLVIPSIMRESYSILARQALGSGVPVLTTDCLGPEEVVIDGQNGMIVPSADPAALREAMRVIITSPHTLTNFKTDRSTHELRSLEECADDYEKLFEELVEDHSTKDGRPAPAGGLKRVLFVVGITGAPLRYRAYLPSEALSARGVDCSVRHYRHPDVDGLAAQADVVVFYRVPATIQIVNLISGLRARGTPTIFDIDDLIFDPDIRDEIPAVTILEPAEAEQWMEGVRRYRATMDMCDAFIASTTPLAAHAEALTGIPSFRFPNGVGRIVGQLSDAAYRGQRTPGPIRIGYLSGTNTHDYDWRHIEASIARVMDEHPSLELWLVGLIEPTPAIGRHSSRIVHRPLVDWRDLPSLLRDLDVNLAPLATGSRFNEAKSAIKWLEAALVGTATVASPTEPFQEVISHGRNGMLAETEDEWYTTVDYLVRHPHERRAFGDSSRREALLDFPPAIQGERYLEILTAVCSRPEPPSRTQTWRQIVDDEPSAPFELDPYRAGDDDHTPAEPQVSLTLRRRIADTRVTLREQGVAAAVARVSRYGASVLKQRLATLKR